VEKRWFLPALQLWRTILPAMVFLLATGFAGGTILPKTTKATGFLSGTVFVFPPWYFK